MRRAKRHKIFLPIAIIGFILPYSQLILFLLENGINWDIFVEQVINTRLSAFAWLDVIISAIALFYFIQIDTLRPSRRHVALSIIGTLLIGVSFGLPIYLYFRESEQA